MWINDVKYYLTRRVPVSPAQHPTYILDSSRKFAQFLRSQLINSNYL